MLQVSLSEKLEVLKNVMASSLTSIIILLIILFLGFLFITTNRNNAKESKKVYILLYITCLLALFIQYRDSFGKMIDYFMNHVFILIYFPNLAVYILAIIIVNIVMWKSMFQRDDKTLKIMNTVAFCSIHYLLVLLLNVISSKGLDIFEATSVYGNKSALALIELSSSIFVLWILLITIYQLIKKYQKGKELVLDEIPEESKYNIKMPSSIAVVDIPERVYATENVEKKKEIEEKREKDIVDVYDNMLTLEDYKLLLELLKKSRSKDQIKEEEFSPRYPVNDFQTLYGKLK